MKNLENNFLSAVVYLTGRPQNALSFLKLITAYLKDNFKKYELILVNDALDKSCADEIKKLAAEEGADQSVTMVNMGNYQGLELSMTAGVNAAIGDFIFEFDNVDTDNGGELTEFFDKVYRKALEGYDIVAAVPEEHGKISSKLFYKIFNMGADAGSRLETEAFRIISRRAVNRIQSLNKFITYRKAVYARCGLKRARITYRGKGADKSANGKERFNTSLDALILFSDVMEKAAMWLFVCFFVFTIGIGVYTVCVYLSPYDAVEGWTFIMLFLSISFTGLFMLLAIVLKYLSVILNVVFKRKNYLVESIEKIK